MIPRQLHVIWIGHQAEFPEECLQTWRQQHPDWGLKVWGNADLSSYGWHCGDQMRQLLKRDIRGVADCMRWEILHNEGGVVVDADMVSLRPLPTWLLECEIFAPWLNELECPGSLSTAVVGAEPGNPLVAEMLLAIQGDRALMQKPISEATGADRLAALRIKHKCQGFILVPSQFFLPRLPRVQPHLGAGPVYAYKKFYAAMGARAIDFQKYLTPFYPGRMDLECNGPFFTVGIANFNRADYLRLAIQSVLDQDYRNFELLIVDDGSSDHSEEVVTSYTDQRVRFLKKEHSGIPRTFNALIAQARGSHMVWMGNDDLCVPGLLRDYAQLLQTWPEIVFSYGDLIVIDSEGQKIDHLSYPDYFGDRMLLSRFLTGNQVPMPGSMTNLGVIRAIGGFDNDLPLSNDFDLWVRLAATGLPFKHIGHPSCCYRMHGSNVTKNIDALAADDLKIMHKMLNTFDLPQICADMDWANDAKRAEVQACERVITLLRHKKDLVAAQSWEQRRQTLLAI